MVLIPGWATDYRIFGNLKLAYNYLLPLQFSPFNFKDELLKTLNKESIDQISLFGWSLGGFLAVEFALKNPQRINELILLSIRKRFAPGKLEEIKQQLKKNKKAYLYKFYLECFSGSAKEGWAWFRRYLIKKYISEMQLKDLIGGLDYLSLAEITPESLISIKNIKIFHGLKDKVAPIAEVDKMKPRLDKVNFVYLAQAGHIPFLGEDFYKFYHG